MTTRALAETAVMVKLGPGRYHLKTPIEISRAVRLVGARRKGSVASSYVLNRLVIDVRKQRSSP